MTGFRWTHAAPPAALLGALALGLAAAAQAPQPQAGGPGSPGGWRGGPERGAMRERMHDEMERRRAQKIADWTTVLKLSPAQAQALSAAMAPHGRGDHRPPPAPGGPPPSTLQQLDSEQARMSEREGRMRERVAAMRNFYASLNPDQQRTFDAVRRLSHHGMRHHRGWGGREDGPGNGGGHGFRGGRGPGGPPPAGE